MISYRYCTQCGSSLELGGSYPRCPECGITFYKNSKPTAGILPIKGGQVLLSKRAIEPYKGAYDIIGGFLEDSEHPRDGAKREAKEETGLDIEPRELLGIYIDRYGEGGDHTLNVHYIGEVKGGEMNAQEDVASLHWVDIEKAPLNEGFENTKEALRDLQSWYKSNKSK